MAENYTAIGGGYMYALGSLYNDQFTGNLVDEKERLKVALHVAAHYHPYTGSDLIILDENGNKIE